MGFLKKEICGICGKSIGFPKYKIPESDAWICGNCLKEIGKTGPFDLNHVTLEELIVIHEMVEKKKTQHDKMVKQDPMQTAEGMFQYCGGYGYGGKRNEIWGIKYFRLIENILFPNEKVLTVFIGLHNYKSMSKHEGNCAYAITSRRFIMAQKSRMMGERIQALSYEDIEDICYTPGGLIETFSIETEEGTIFIGVDKNYADRIHQRMKKAIKQAVKNKKFQIME